EEDTVEFVVDGTWWVKSARILAGQHATVQDIYWSQTHGKGDIHGQYADFLRLFAAVKKPSTSPTLITRVVQKPANYAATAFFNMGYDLNDPRTFLQNGIMERTKGVGLVVSSWTTKVTIQDEVAKWPYSFPASKDFKQAHERGMISGRLFLYDKCISYEHMLGNGSYIGLAPPRDLGSWECENKGYQFWSKTNDEGHFSFENILAGTYNIYAWVDGFIGSATKRPHFVLEKVFDLKPVALPEASPEPVYIIERLFIDIDETIMQEPRKVTLKIKEPGIRSNDTTLALVDINDDHTTNKEDDDMVQGRP
ncbi:probable rhamnogalacturonate lyase B, partial [Tanacetum coccineum]